MDKRVASAEAAVARIHDGATILMGGFGASGVAENLVRALCRQGTRDLTIVSNNAGIHGYGIDLLLKNKQVKKMIASFVGGNKTFEQLALKKEIELELNPQGTLAERVRCGGAGIPAFFTPTGYGTLAAEGKEVREFNGRPHILVPSLRGDFALVKAWKADRLGNLIYRRTARNFNPNAATCGKVTVAEAEIIVEPGELDPDEIHTPGIFVHRVVHNPNPEKRIEKITTREV